MLICYYVILSLKSYSVFTKILHILFVDRNENVVPLHRQWRRKDAPQLARKIFLVHEEIPPHEGLSDPEFGNSKNFKH